MPTMPTPTETMSLCEAPECVRVVITHAELVQIAASYLARRLNCALVLTEMSTCHDTEIPDAIGWTTRGASHLIECKRSRSDFLADAKKDHRFPGNGMGLNRYYLAVPGIIKPDELDEYWGLIEVGAKHPKLIKKAMPRPVFYEVAERRLLIAATRRLSNFQVQPFATVPKRPRVMNSATEPIYNNELREWGVSLWQPKK